MSGVEAPRDKSVVSKEGTYGSLKDHMGPHVPTGSFQDRHTKPLRRGSTGVPFTRGGTGIGHAPEGETRRRCLSR